MTMIVDDSGDRRTWGIVWEGEVSLIPIFSSFLTDDCVVDWHQGIKRSHFCSLYNLTLNALRSNWNSTVGVWKDVSGRLPRMCMHHYLRKPSHTQAMVQVLLSTSPSVNVYTLYSVFAKPYSEWRHILQRYHPLWDPSYTPSMDTSHNTPYDTSRSPCSAALQYQKPLHCTNCNYLYLTNNRTASDSKTVVRSTA